MRADVTSCLEVTLSITRNTESDNNYLPRMIRRYEIDIAGQHVLYKSGTRRPAFLRNRRPGLARRNFARVQPNRRQQLARGLFQISNQTLVLSRSATVAFNLRETHPRDTSPHGNFISSAAAHILTISQFYSETILSRRGPLGKVWLAAHMERKLSKTQTLQTDIEQSVGAHLNFCEHLTRKPTLNYRRDHGPGN